MSPDLAILSSYDTIGLAEMDSAKLLDRMDFKFMFERSKLEGMLQLLQPHYFVLSVVGQTASRYCTHYFDTDTLQMYIQHHNGKLNRYKLRFRSYLDSNTHFFEIKFKSNQGRTVKDRVKLKNADITLGGEAGKFLQKHTKYQPDTLHEAIQVEYSRITLVRRNLAERVTIDLNLQFSHGNKYCEFPNLVIAEVKQQNSNQSPFKQAMQKMHIKASSISKYCLGVASLYQGIKINRFKTKLNHVHQICQRGH